MSYTREQRRKYQKARREKIKSEMLALLGGRCACGKTTQLEFDHKDPTTKKFAISHGLDKPRGILLEEVRKCQLLCHDCHLKKSIDEGSLSKANIGKRLIYRHGRSAGYNLDRCRCSECREWKKTSRLTKKPS